MKPATRAQFNGDQQIDADLQNHHHFIEIGYTDGKIQKWRKNIELESIFFRLRSFKKISKGDQKNRTAKKYIGFVMPALTDAKKQILIRFDEKRYAGAKKQKSISEGRFTRGDGGDIRYILGNLIESTRPMAI